MTNQEWENYRKSEPYNCKNRVENLRCWVVIFCAKFEVLKVDHAHHEQYKVALVNELDNSIPAQAHILEDQRICNLYTKLTAIGIARPDPFSDQKVKNDSIKRQ
jgi:hypothetical protein